MTKAQALLIAAAALVSGTASAQSLPTKDLMVGSIVSGFETSCVLSKPTLAKPWSFEKVAYETTYEVSFTYYCHGHDLNIGFKATAKTDPTYYPLQNQTMVDKKGKPAVQVAFVTGASSLLPHDPEPATTKRLTFNPDCQFVVTNVKTAPSNAALLHWKDEALAQAKAINSAVRLYNYSRTFDSMSRWSYGKLTAVLNKVNSLIGDDPDAVCESLADSEADVGNTIHYCIMKHTLESAIRNAPVPYATDEIDEAEVVVMDELRADLDAEVDRGEAIVRRYQAAKKDVDKALTDALASVPAA